MKEVQCALCGCFYTALTAAHLSGHNITVEEYRTKYGPLNAKEMREELTTVFDKTELAQFALEGIKPEEWTDILANASIRIFSDEARQATLSSAYILAQMRMSLFQESFSLMGKVLKELNQEWRTKMTEEGEPVSIRELNEIGQIAQIDMKHAGEMLMRLTSYIVQDNKGVVGKESVGEKKAFSGEMDRAAIPSEFTPRVREKLRGFLENLVPPKEEKTISKLEMVDGKDADNTSTTEGS